jgi:hypothetical protein
VHDSAKHRRPFLLGAGTLGLGLLVAGTRRATARPGGSTLLALPVTGTTRAGHVITGAFAPAAFDAGSTGMLQLHGVLNLVGIGAAPASLPVSTIAQASCTVLDLRLGPLDLTLKELETGLNAVRLLIETSPAGGPLGRQLCSIANLLDGRSDADIVGPLIGLLNGVLRLFS